MFVPKLRSLAAGLALAASVAVSSCASCRTPAEVPEATYREAVTAFHTALAALETSQEPLARQKLDRVIALVPQEPAGWANLGLLLLRQQENAPARERLTKAAELAPESGAIERLLATAESRAGNSAASVQHWRRALELDPGNAKAAYALAQEVERQGTPEADAEAQRTLETLLAAGDNLPVRLDAIRLAAKRGDGAAVKTGLDALAAQAPSWPAAAQTQFDALRKAAATNPRAAATRVLFLKNVLVREPAYRRALAQISTPLDGVGEPIEQFLVLANPKPGAAAPDAGLTFSSPPKVAPRPDVTWAGAFIPAADAPPVMLAGGKAGLFVGERAVTALGPMAVTSGADAVLAADLNYDFRTDLVVASPNGVAFLRQGADGTFANATRETALPAAIVGAPARAVWAADADTDGDLDVVLAAASGAPVLLRNNSDGTFAVQTPFAGVPGARGFAWADLDGEGVPDAAFVDDAGRLHVLLNLRGGAFQADALPADAGSVSAVAAVEATGDATFDLVTVAPDGELAVLSRGERGSWTRTVATTSPAAAGSTRLVAGDLDNNGAVDLIASRTMSSTVFLSSGPGQFTALGSAIGADVRAVADFGDDGRLELIALAGGQPVLLNGKGTRDYGWQIVRPKAATATGDQRINSFGIGGSIEVRTGLHLQRVPIDAPIVHVGLGTASAAEVIRIEWPNGVLQSEFDRPAKTTVAASQRLKGSCPWLFAWNGREMAFVTDLIWRSPLGLRINAQDTADVLTTEDWVKVRGDQLVARDGAYDLRITAELWETHFFDLVSLLTVDHPAGTEVWVDERFTIPTPTLAPIVTGPVQPLAAARDDRGQDITALLATQDDRHADFAGRGAWQGVTRPHAIELTLPESAPRTGPLWLIARGWVHPTDSSVNVAMSHGKHAAPQGLALEAATGDGPFRPVRSGLGFPSGKDKTVLLDLSEAFPAGSTGARRLRLSTNLEIFWDRIGWAVGRPDVQVAPRRLPTLSADLRYRGYNDVRQSAPSSPERPRYALAGTAPRWRDLEGYHTRFGDVRELLAGVDDRYVIMNAGDEIAIRIGEAPPPAAGMVRDFILVGDGWVKDGDFNTTFSRTVLPLPTHATGRYTTPPRTLEEDPVYQRHRADFETYHTRYVAPDRLVRALQGAGPTSR
jgi:tetratricopeptide (TPR) repeat protein